MAGRKIHRRDFVKYMGCGAMGSATMLSSVLNLRALNAAAITDSSVAMADDYKALVCLVMDGGNDSYNMLIPTSSQEYQTYARVRSTLALSRNNILNLNGTTAGRSFALHPSLKNLQTLYNQGQAAFIANIGTLIEPLTVDQFLNQQKKAPLGLLSHSDQLQQWQTGIPHDRSATGWGGRIADLINDTQPPYNSNSKISMNISLSGTNTFQTGVNTSQYSINPQDGPVGFIGYDDFPILQRAVDNLLEQNYTDIFKKTYMQGLRKSRDSFRDFTAALNGVRLNTTFPRTKIGYSFYQIARSIAARDILGFKRQTFFINVGGWDHHDELLINQAELLKEVDDAIMSFQMAMAELNTVNNVTTFAISDFARTLGSNGNGTDHAWGGHVFAVGGSVKGQKIYGQYPQTLDYAANQYDLGTGIVMPTTSADLYFAELALWFGVSKSNLELIFPNLRNFYDYRIDSNQNPLNLLTMF